MEVHESPLVRPIMGQAPPVRQKKMRRKIITIYDEDSENETMKRLFQQHQIKPCRVLIIRYNFDKSGKPKVEGKRKAKKPTKPRKMVKLNTSLKSKTVAELEIDTSPSCEGFKHCKSIEGRATFGSAISTRKYGANSILELHVCPICSKMYRRYKQRQRCLAGHGFQQCLKCFQVLKYDGRCSAVLKVHFDERNHAIQAGTMCTQCPFCKDVLAFSNLELHIESLHLTFESVILSASPILRKDHKANKKDVAVGDNADQCEDVTTNEQGAAPACDYQEQKQINSNFAGRDDPDNRGAVTDNQDARIQNHNQLCLESGLRSILRKSKKAPSRSSNKFVVFDKMVQTRVYERQIDSHVSKLEMEPPSAKSLAAFMNRCFDVGQTLWVRWIRDNVD